MPKELNIQSPAQTRRGWTQLAPAAAAGAWLVLCLPWFYVELGPYRLSSGAPQILFQTIGLNGALLSYPLAARAGLGLALAGLATGVFLFLRKKFLAAAFWGLAACAGLIVCAVALWPLHALLAEAAGLTLGMEERAWHLGGGFGLALLLGLVFSFFAFVRHSRERFFARLFGLAALVSMAVVFLLTLYLLALGLPAIAKIGPLRFLFGGEWAPTHAQEPRYGIRNMILASIFGTTGAVLIGVPIGLMTAVFLAEIAPRSLRALVRPAIELLAGIPSVLYGFFALQVIVPGVQTLFRLPSGTGLLAAMLVLAIMILPTIVTTAETGLRAVPPMYKEASLALGASQIRTIFKVLLPGARTTVLSGVILGVGRAIGETMAIIMVAGGTASFPRLLGSVRPLTVGIVMEMSYATGLHRDALFAIGLVLFVFIMLVNISFTYLAKKGVRLDG